MRGIHIIGGGLAGLSLGQGLRLAGIPVTVYEAGHYPRHRVCGEFISGLGRPTIERLGLAPALAPAVRLSSVRWYGPGRLLRADELPTPALGLSRWHLDQALAEGLVQAGGDLHTKRRLPRRRREADDQESWVDCAGRQPQTSSPWVGLKCQLVGFRAEADLEMHMSANGYLGISRVEDSVFNLCGLFRKAGLKQEGAHPLVFAYLRQCGFSKLLERLAPVRPVAGSDCSVAGLGYGEASGFGDGFRLGDAAGLIPPFTGNGMTLAFETAALALDPLEAYARGEHTWAEARNRMGRAYQSVFGRRLRIARSLHRCLVSPRLFPLTAAAARTPLFPFHALFQLTR